MPGSIGHAPAAVRRAEASAFAGIRHDPVQPANVAVHPQKTSGQDSAIKEGGQLPFNEPRHQTPASALTGQKSLEMAGHRAIEYALFWPARAVLAGCLANGWARAAKYKIAPLRLSVPFENRCRVWADRASRNCLQPGFHNMTNRSRLDLSRKFTGHAISMSRSNAAQGEPFGTDYTAGVLTGSREDRILANQHHTLSTYRIQFEESRSAVRDWIKQLVEQECVERAGDYAVLRVTDKGHQVLKGKELPLLLETAKKRAAPKPRAKGDKWEGVDRDLFEELRKLQRQLAQERSMPACIVFSDAALCATWPGSVRARRRSFLASQEQGPGSSSSKAK